MSLFTLFGNVTINFDLSSWKIALILFVISVLTLIFGSLPDNPPRPFVDKLRWIFIPITIFYFLALAIRGMTS